MADIKSNSTGGRVGFSSVESDSDYPNFLDIQIGSFKKFFQVDTPPENRVQEGLTKVFMEHFPVEDQGKSFLLEFIDYTVDGPQYTPRECIVNGTTYSVPLRVKFRLIQNNDDAKGYQNIEQEVFMGNIPYMTPQGSFVVNGIERVVVSQIHKSVGVFFTQSKHSSGVMLYSARIIPFKGSWIEFSVDVNGAIYAYIDRKKKFPLTTLLRAIGYGTDKEILNVFGVNEEVKVIKKTIKEYIGRRLAIHILKTWSEDFFDEDTGEVVSVERNEILVERGTIITDEVTDIIIESGTKNILLNRDDLNNTDYNFIYSTLNKDDSNSEIEAIHKIYYQLKNASAPNEQIARETVHGLFFSNKRYDLGIVGRYRINSKLNLNIADNVTVLTKEDIICITKHLIGLVTSRSFVDDIDHLSNRRVRTVGEQFYEHFGVGLSRMVKSIRDRMNVRDNENIKPLDLIHTRTLTNALTSFFTLSNPLSQFADNLNPLSGIVHKRRISSLGPNGLSKDRAGFEVRDIQPSYIGKLCAIETPEGPNIGLISSLCLHARINPMGFIETPYIKVENSKVDKKRIKNYFTVEEEETYNIAQASSKVTSEAEFVEDKIKVRTKGDFVLVEPNQVNYIDVSTNQYFSVAASLIPFLEHTDPTRGLMGANMQRQAVPLLKSESPIVGTGIEKRVATDFGGLLYAESDGIIEYVDARKISILHSYTDEEKLVLLDNPLKHYEIPKFERTNHNTCFNLKPIVKKGDIVKKGQLLCEGFSTQSNELGLGKNVVVAFMPWRGYNYEDAIVVSERMTREDIFTSIHIEKFVLEARDTEFGPEEFTVEIPNVSDSAISNLDKNGVVRVGTRVKEGDILIGKITPKGIIDPAPEEKFLRAIFGDKASDVKDSSLRASSYMDGVVMDTKLFERIGIKGSKTDVEKKLKSFKANYSRDLKNLKTLVIQKLADILENVVCQGVYHKFGDNLISKGQIFNKEIIEKKLFTAKNVYRDETNLNVPEESNLIGGVVIKGWTDNDVKNELIKSLIINYGIERSKIVTQFKKEKFNLDGGHNLPPGVLKLGCVYICTKRKLKVGDKMSGRHGNKGIVSKIVKQEDMPFLADGTPVDVVLSSLGVPPRMNLGQLFETALGWAGLKLNKKYVTPIFNGVSEAEISSELSAAGLPEFGRTNLYDGLTGEKFDQKVTVGVIYLLKLNHLVDDKMHARSIGPYSMITQQPLGGKAQFGGQRFGEMEVWALEAYGAAHTLQEMMTVKSDDISGRSRTYEAIVKGGNIPDPGTPEAFNVLVQELRGLGLEVVFIK